MRHLWIGGTGGAASPFGFFLFYFSYLGQQYTAVSPAEVAHREKSTVQLCGQTPGEKALPPMREKDGGKQSTSPFWNMPPCQSSVAELVMTSEQVGGAVKSVVSDTWLVVVVEATAWAMMDRIRGPSCPTR